MNKEKFSFRSSYGTLFTCANSDFSTQVRITRSIKISDKAFYRDFAEMISYHCLFIRPELKGFAGYDCVDFSLVTTEA